MEMLSLQQEGNFGAAMLASKGIEVPLARLDDFSFETLTLVKVDVEGFEWQVLQGAAETLRRHRPVLYLEAKRLPGTLAYLAWLMSQGWRCFWHFAAFYRQANFRGNQQNIFGNVGDMNVLAVPQGQAIPDDLPEIGSPQENWQETYVAFFRKREATGSLKPMT